MNNKILQSVVFLFGLTVAFSLPLWAEGDVNEAENVAAPFATHDDKAYVIGSTNLIFIKVLGESALQDKFRVDESGYITHPLLNRVKIGGKTVSEAEEMIKGLLAGDYILNPNVTVFVVEHSRFSVLGEVRKPGNYEILGRLSIEEGLSIAGGFTPIANMQRVKILRHDESGKEKTLIINIQAIMDGKEESISIQAGDVIEVLKSFF